MITVLGSSGFIGSHLVKKLEERQIAYQALAKGNEISGKDLGHVIYCIGLTADFRQKPFETVEAHVCLLSKILKECRFETLTYLSSTRVYINCVEKEVSEDTAITVRMNDPSELYTLTKLTGERLCLSSGKKTKIARLSNVYGSNDMSDNFLTNIIKQAEAGQIDLQSTAASAKDYIDIESVTDLLIRLAQSDQQGIFNIASGANTSNEDIIAMLKQQYRFEHTFSPTAREIVFPSINIDRVKKEFSFESLDITAYFFNQTKNK